MQNPNRDIDILTPAVRRALMQHNSEYFTLSPAEREAQRAEWAVKTPRDLLDAIYEGAVQDGMTKTAKPHPVLNAEDSNYNNLLSQAVLGAGDDFLAYFMGLPEGETLLTLSTVGDFQCRARGEPNSDSAQDRFDVSLYAEHIRLIDQGDALQYYAMSEIAAYVVFALDDAQTNIIKDVIPYDYKKSADNGKSTPEGGMIFGRTLDAGGYESLHGAMQRAYFEYRMARFVAIQDRFNTYDPVLWVIPGEIDEDDPFQGGAATHDIVFSGSKAMDLVRHRHFLADVHALDAGADFVKEVIAEETEALREHLTKAYEVLLPQHPKGLVPFERKKKIVFSPEALKDLPPID